MSKTPRTFQALSCLSATLIFPLALAQADPTRCDRPLPEDKQLNAQNFSLTCTSGVSHYIRQSEPFDYEEWRKWEGTDSKEGYEYAQDFRQKVPEPQWKGSITYAVIEDWDYDTIETSVVEGCPKVWQEIDVEETVGAIRKATGRTVAGRNGGSSTPAPSRSSSGGSAGRSSSSGSRNSSGSSSTRSGGSSGYGSGGLRVAKKMDSVTGNSKIGGGGGYFGTKNDSPSHLPKAKKVEKQSGEPYRYKERSTTTGSDSTPAPVRQPVKRWVKKKVLVTLPCPHPVTHHASRVCSREVMTFNANYVRPSKKDWNPSTPGYLNIFPNKYDLLMPEIEDVQVFNTNERSSRLNPSVVIGDAYNDYRVDILTKDGQPLPSGGLACAPNVSPELKIAIHTLKRKTGLQTPNPLKEPVDEFGEKIRWFNYETAMNNKGVDTKAKPYELRLSDTVNFAMHSLTRQSQNAGIDFNSSDDKKAQTVEVQKSPDPDKKSVTSFWAQTKVRIKLIEKTGRFSRDILKSPPLVVAGSDVSRGEGSYEIRISGGQYNLYKANAPKHFRWISRFVDSVKPLELQPNTKYQYLVSVRHNLPFYKNDCKDDDDDSCYSKPLVLDYDMSDIDRRSGANKVFDFLGTP